MFKLVLEKAEEPEIKLPISAGSSKKQESSRKTPAAAAKSLQSCPTLCNPIHGSPPGSPVPGILQARTLEWVAISFSNAWKWKVKVKSLSHVWLSVIPWTAAYQAPPSMGFPGKNTGVGCHCLLLEKHLFVFYWLCQNLCVDHNKLWKILKEMGIPDHLTCLLRNLYAGQEATGRTGHATTDWFQIGKGVRQGCKLSPCLFNLYAEYFMRNSELEEAQAGIKIAGRISVTSDMQMTPPLWHKVNKN